MKAIKRTVTIEDPRQLILTDLPFRQGQRVEVVLLTEEDTAYHLAELKALFQTAQSLPQVQSISEEEIAAEIAAHRAAHEGSD